ncbi:hypothetical protein ACP70R_002920 [Stipagrostis hirtigluma subsp. patula]
MPSRRLGGRARRRRAHRRRRWRDWADGLPMDALLAIFHRLDHIVVLTAADNVCRSWRRAARDEPTLWRRVAMRGREGVAARLNRCGLACEAVRRSAGRCEAFCGEHAGDDGFLIYLSERATCLKSLRLISCNGVTDEGFTEAMKELPLLEELELSLCKNVSAEAYEVVGKVCPQLKHFRLSKLRFDIREWNKDKDARGIATMHRLHSLQLFGNAITNDGLVTILDNCSQLESLDIRHCFNIEMDDDETLLPKSARIKTLRLPDDPIDDYDLHFESPVRSYIDDDVSWSSDCYDSCSYDNYEDYEESDFFGEPSRYEDDLDRYDKMLPLSMRTFLK